MKNILLFVLTMTFICVNAQDLIVPKTGDPIKAYHLEVSDKNYFYTLSPQSNGEILKIEKENVLIVRKADGTTVSESSHEKEGTSENNFPVINEEDIHGSLIAQGNCVYIPTNSAFSYERAGQTKLKELVSEWNYWTVVDKLEQAHFILQFVTMTSGHDASFLVVRPRKYYIEYPSVEPFYHKNGGVMGAGGSAGSFDDSKKSRAGIIVNFMSSNEDSERNAHNAERMFQHFKELLIDRESKLSTKFFKYHSKALDADADNNNSYFCHGIWLLK